MGEASKQQLEQTPWRECGGGGGGGGSMSALPKGHLVLSILDQYNLEFSEAVRRQAGRR